MNVDEYVNGATSSQIHNINLQYDYNDPFKSFDNNGNAQYQLVINYLNQLLKILVTLHQILHVVMIHPVLCLVPYEVLQKNH